MTAPAMAVMPPPAPHANTAEANQRRRRGRGGTGSKGSKSGSGRQEEQLRARMVQEFKTMPCTQEAAMTSHDHRCCPFFHSERDRRRAVVAADGSGPPAYRAEPCPNQFDDSRKCARGDTCGFCHSTAELLYHPEFYRKRLCHQARRCPRARFCAFAHTRDELLVPFFGEMEETNPSEDFIAHKFKTQWCPIGGTHDWENCVYAHTYRDWRRIPSLGYDSRPCPHWVQSVSSGNAELAYTDRCPHGIGCPLAHGAKEQLYHPQFYKTSPCSEASCKRGALCAFTHGPHDLRCPVADDEETKIKSAAERESVIQAEQLLFSNQPTFWQPPRYHALEEPPKAHGKGGGKGGNNAYAANGKQQQGGKGKKGQGKGQAAPLELPLGAGNQGDASARGVNSAAIPASGDASERTPPPALSPLSMPATSAPLFSTNSIPPAGAGVPPIALPPMSSPQFTMPGMAPYFEPWMMMQQPQSRLMGPMGYDVPGGGGMTGPAAADATAAMQSNPWAQLAAFQPALPNAFINLTAQAAAEEHLRKALGDLTPSTAAEDGTSSAIGSDAPRGKKPSDIVKKLSRQQDYLLRKGMRTPSSLGSPLLSSAPTETATPRDHTSEGSTMGSDETNDKVSNEFWAKPPTAGMNVDHKMELDGQALDDDCEPLQLQDAPVNPSSPMKLRLPAR